MRLFSRKRGKAKKSTDARKSIAVRTPNSPPATADWNTKFDAILGPKKVRLFYWPNYSSNPYQMLFYGAETDMFSPKPGTLEQALAELRGAKGGHVCFHLHWLNFLFRSTPNDPRDASARVEEFLSQLNAFLAEGGLFFWTAHNLREHEGDDGPLEQSLRRKIAEMAHAIFVHGANARAAFLADQSQIAATTDSAEIAAKTRVIDHGHYTGVYPDEITKPEARKRLSLPLETTVFASVGWLRRYKGLTTLCETVEALNNTTLVIAGRSSLSGRQELLDALATYPKTKVYEGWVETFDLQIYMNSADFIVLPYVASLTSGAALLALSFGVPVIAPRLGAFPEVVSDGATGYLYDPHDADGLASALTRACHTSPSERAIMGLHAFRSAASFDWATSRRVLFDQIVGNSTG
ncbi:MAG: glycosyltransferase family 4 protein [Pseudomonadota bacterium]